MSNIEKLKKRAAEFEAKRQPEKAIAAYLDLFDEWDATGGADVEVGLYNRAGDLMLREGRVADAVAVWERAVDQYADGGFHNNAIALCNKILRNSPGRTSVYYKLGRISAQKGFRSDARRNFLEYADRKRKANEVDEAFRALKEFADLCPDEYDIRQMLAEQLATLGRAGEAIEQLQLLYDRYESSGATTEAAATVARMRTIDPTVEPQRAGPRPASEPRGLVFLDLDDHPALASRPPMPSAMIASPAPVETPALPPIAGRAPSVPAGAPRLPTTRRTPLPAADLPYIVEDAPAAPPRVDAASRPGGTSIGDPLELTPESVTDPVEVIADSVEPEPIAPVSGFEPTTLASDGERLDVAEDASEPVTGNDLEAPAASPHASHDTMALGSHSVVALRHRVAVESENWDLHRSLGEALLDLGDREDGIAELARALRGFDASGDLASARSVADELRRMQPNDIAVQQKRVELAVRSGERADLIEAYLEFAHALVCAGETDKARAVYQRVITIAPDDARGHDAVQALGRAPKDGDAPDPTRDVGSGADHEYVSLGDWLREDEAPKSTRMVVDEEAPTGDEDADFKDMLERFKRGVAANVDEADHESHYDLGVAFKEMGLIDEAIAEFQKALRGTTQRARTFEALGQCFFDKGQVQVAMTILKRAVAETGAGDDQLVGVLYLLGVAAEALGRPRDAIAYFQRVFAVDITFRDVGPRLQALDLGA